MFGIVTALGSAIINSISTYYNNKQAINKVKVEAEKEIIVAESKATIAKLARESEQDFDLDKKAMENMEKSWKDELILIIWLIPIILCFIPEYADYVDKGFKVLATTPDWYQWILIGMVVVIYGMRGLFKTLLTLLISKLK